MSTKSVLGDLLGVANKEVVKTVIGTIDNVDAIPEVKPTVDHKFVLMATECGKKLVDAGKLQVQADQLKKEVNKLIVELYKAKISVGRKGKCSIANAFHQAILDNGAAKSTADNYLSVFKKAVNNGQVVTDWNSYRNVETGKAKTAKEDLGSENVSDSSSTKEKTDSEKFVDRMKGIFNFGEGEYFKKLCLDIEAQYQNDEIDCVYAGFINYLEENGNEVEMKEGIGKSK